MALDIDQYVQGYIFCRDRLKEVEAKYEAEKKKWTDMQEKIDGKIRAFMVANNITQGLKTSTGTCYLSTRYTASVADAELFMNFVKAGNWDMIERRANATAVKDYVHEHNQLPPGCNLSAIETLGVRRPTVKKK